MQQDSKLIEEELTGETIGGFFTVYNALGYGFWESVYANALTVELTKRGLLVEREKLVQVYYENQPIAQFRLDMLVENRLLVEIKSCSKVGEVEHRQLFNYLRATDFEIALLLHFGPKPAFNRFVWTKKQKRYRDPVSSAQSVSSA